MSTRASCTKNHTFGGAAKTPLTGRQHVFELHQLLLLAPWNGFVYPGGQVHAGMFHCERQRQDLSCASRLNGVCPLSEALAKLT